MSAIGATAPSTQSTPSRTAATHERLDTVQALRALAALSVVGMHIPAIDRGAFGVDLFFVISGFICCHVAAADPGRFIVKRLIRVVPLYWLCTLAVFALAMAAPHLMGATRADWGELAKSLAFVPFMKSNGNVHPVLYLGWTLNYEMLFYALFALSLWLAPQRPQWVVVPLLLALIVLGRTVAFDSVPLRFWTAPILVEFVYGIVAYGLWQRGAFARWHPAIAVALALGGLLSMLLVHPDDSHRAWQWGLPAFIVFVAMLSLEGRWRVPWLWLLIGNASYSLYLTQAYVLQAIQKKVMPLDAFTATQVLMMAAATVVCCAVAVLFFKLIERPSNLWLRRRLLSPRAAAVQRRAPAAYRA